MSATSYSRIEFPCREMQSFPDKMVLFDTVISSFLSGHLNEEQYMLSWTGWWHSPVLPGHSTLTTTSGYHRSTKATVTQQSTAMSVKKTHSLWHAWDVTSSSLPLRVSVNTLSRDSLFNIRAVITWCIHFTMMHTSALCRIKLLPVTHVLVDTWMFTVMLVYELSDVPDHLKWATNTYDTIYTHFQGITNNIYGFGRPFLYPSTTHISARPSSFLPVLMMGGRVST